MQPVPCWKIWRGVHSDVLYLPPTYSGQKGELLWPIFLQYYFSVMLQTGCMFWNISYSVQQRSSTRFSRGTISSYAEHNYKSLVDYKLTARSPDRYRLKQSFQILLTFVYDHVSLYYAHEYWFPDVFNSLMSNKLFCFCLENLGGTNKTLWPAGRAASWGNLLYSAATTKLLIHPQFSHITVIKSIFMSPLASWWNPWVVSFL